FIGLFIANNYKNKEAIEDNEYEKENLKQETIDQIDDPLYGNQIVPEDLNEKIASGEAVTVYFYSPRCVYCQRTTPVLVPRSEEHTSELQSRFDLVCRLLLEKKNKTRPITRLHMGQ